MSALAANLSTLPIWKTIKIGVYQQGYETELKRLGIELWRETLDLLESTFVSEQEIELDLVRVTAAEIKPQGNSHFKDICAEACRFGLELCPTEVGPALRLEYLDQPAGEMLLVGMDPILDSDDHRMAFLLDRKFKPRLVTLEANYGCFSTMMPFVFVRPRSTS